MLVLPNKNAACLNVPVSRNNLKSGSKTVSMGKAMRSGQKASGWLNAVKGHLLAQEGIQMVRYADDFVLLCRTEVEARAALERCKHGRRRWVYICIRKRPGSWMHPCRASWGKRLRNSTAAQSNCYLRFKMLPAANTATAASNHSILQIWTACQSSRVVAVNRKPVTAAAIRQAAPRKSVTSEALVCPRASRNAAKSNHARMPLFSDN